MKDDSIKSKTIEWLRFFCIAAVVLQHAKGCPLDGNEVVSFRYGAYDTIRILFSDGLCRVAVPIFFLISGYLFFVRLEKWDKGIWLEKIKKRMRTLLVPYLLWNFIAIAFSLSILYLQFILKGGESPDIVAWYDGIDGLRAFWNSGGGGHPINYPLWFIRDLMVFVILAPLVFQYIKKTGIIGLIILYLAYVLDFWVKIPGFSAEGLFFFAFGAYFAIHGIDFSTLFKKHWIAATVIACPLVIAMVLTYGIHDDIWGYARRLFTLFGGASTIGIVALLFEKQRLKNLPLLSNSSFFIYAAHGTMVLPILQSGIGKILPSNQIGLIIGYFLAPFMTVAILVFCYYYLSNWMPKTIAVLTGGR